MGSINAQRVAHKVAEKVKRNELVNMGEIIEEVGYSKSIALKPDKVTKTQSYQKALAIEQKPLLERLKKEIDRIEQAIAQKNLQDEEYRVLIGSLDILIRNYQLLSGGATERNVLVLPSEVMARNELLQSNDTLMLDGGSTEPLNE